MFLCTPVFILIIYLFFVVFSGVRCSSVVRAFAHGAMGCRIDPSLGGLIELLTGVRKAILSVGWCILRTLAANRK